MNFLEYVLSGVVLIIFFLIIYSFFKEQSLSDSFDDLKELVLGGN